MIENSVRAFFNACLLFLGKEIREGTNILIDSIGLPESAEDIAADENRRLFNGRQVYVKETQVKCR